MTYILWRMYCSWIDSWDFYYFVYKILKVSELTMSFDEEKKKPTLDNPMWIWTHWPYPAQECSNNGQCRWLWSNYKTIPIHTRSWSSSTRTFQHQNQMQTEVGKVCLVNTGRHEMRVDTIVSRFKKLGVQNTLERTPGGRILHWKPKWRAWVIMKLNPPYIWEVYRGKQMSMH